MKRVGTSDIISMRADSTPVVLSSASTSSVTRSHSVYTRHTTPVMQQSLTITGESNSQAVELSTSNSDVAEIDDAGQISANTPGRVYVYASTPRGKRAMRISTFTAGGSYMDVFAGYSEGTAEAVNAAAIDSGIAGKTPEIAWPIYSDLVNGTLSANRWTADLDLSCLAASNNRNGWTGKGAGVAVSSRCILTSNHYKFAAGVTLRFADASGTVVERVTGQSLQVGTEDLAVTVLTQALPETIVPAKLLDHTTGMLVDYPDRENMPVIVVNQDRHAFVRMFSLYPTLEYLIAKRYAEYGRSYSTPDRDAFGGYIRNYDSSSPVFVVTNDGIAMVGIVIALGFTDVYCEYVGQFLTQIAACEAALTGDT